MKLILIISKIHLLMKTPSQQFKGLKVYELISCISKIEHTFYHLI